MVPPPICVNTSAVAALADGAIDMTAGVMIATATAAPLMKRFMQPLLGYSLPLVAEANVPEQMSDGLVPTGHEVGGQLATLWGGWVRLFVVVQQPASRCNGNSTCP